MLQNTDNNKTAISFERLYHLIILIIFFSLFNSTGFSSRICFNRFNLIKRREKKTEKLISAVDTFVPLSFSRRCTICEEMRQECECLLLLLSYFNTQKFNYIHCCNFCSNCFPPSFPPPRRIPLSSFATRSLRSSLSIQPHFTKDVEMCTRQTLQIR